MRKSIVFALAFVAILALGVIPAMAGNTCGSVEAKLGKTDSKIDAKAACTSHGTDVKNETLTISVIGMTCGGCENALTTALKGTDGVLDVIKVSHKEGLAIVSIDPTKTKSANITKMITNKGYKAEIIPAVATSGAQAGAQAGCDKMSKADCAKACGDKAAAACGKKDTEDTKTTDGSL